MAMAKKCDVCGVLYEGYNMTDNAEKVNGLQFLNIRNDSKAYSHSFIDVCPVCMTSIKNHIRMLKIDAKEE